MQNCLSKLMQGQALNTIRPHNTFYSTLQPIVMYIEILVPHLANKKRSLQVFLFFISLHVWSDCNELSVIFDNDNDIEQNVHEIFYDTYTCTCINKTSVTLKTDHRFQKIFSSWHHLCGMMTIHIQFLLLIIKIIHIHARSWYLNFIS